MYWRSFIVIGNLFIYTLSWGHMAPIKTRQHSTKAPQEYLLWNSLYHLPLYDEIFSFNQTGSIVETTIKKTAKSLPTLHNFPFKKRFLKSSFSTVPSSIKRKKILNAHPLPILWLNHHVAGQTPLNILFYQALIPFFGHELIPLNPYSPLHLYSPLIGEKTYTVKGEKIAEMLWKKYTSQIQNGSYIPTQCTCNNTLEKNVTDSPCCFIDILIDACHFLNRHNLPNLLTVNNDLRTVFIKDNAGSLFYQKFALLNIPYERDPTNAIIPLHTVEAKSVSQPNKRKPQQSLLIPPHILKISSFQDIYSNSFYLQLFRQELSLPLLWLYKKKLHFILMSKSFSLTTQEINGFTTKLISTRHCKISKPASWIAQKLWKKFRIVPTPYSSSNKWCIIDSSQKKHTNCCLIDRLISACSTINKNKNSIVNADTTQIEIHPQSKSAFQQALQTLQIPYKYSTTLT